MSPIPPKAPDDSGAFGMLNPDQKRIVEGATYWIGARIASKTRSLDGWNISLLLNIHRNLFGQVFPEHAGKLRLKDVAFRNYIIPAPGQILYRLTDLVKDARAIIEQASTIADIEERIATILPEIAQFHATCVAVQPFIDGNKRWARQVLSAILVDSGFWPGTRIDIDDRERYMEGLDKSIAGNHDQLASLILDGWTRLEADFSSGAY
jgi:fido (protein-threonine AMPylation protein)